MYKPVNNFDLKKSFMWSSPIKLFSFSKFALNNPFLYVSVELLKKGEKGRCILTGKPSIQRDIFAKAY